MIRIGLSGWGDHYSIYPAGMAAKDKLKEYSGHYPLVEVDSSFYAVQPVRNFEKWDRETPPSFGFIVKAYQGMTGHLRGPNPFKQEEDMYDAFMESIEPIRNSGKLKAVLFQFPPWFNCTKMNVERLRWIKSKLEALPAALEFRHQSWYTERYRQQTLDFMKQEGWIHSVCDEPQAGEGSIPIVPTPTHPQMTLVRFHGRNVQGWTAPVEGEEWRNIRYLYQYSSDELQEWSARLRELALGSKEVCVIFNNNSGGHAADNAKEMIDLLDIRYEGLSSRQMDLFDY